MNNQSDVQEKSPTQMAQDSEEALIAHPRRLFQLILVLLLVGGTCYLPVLVYQSCQLVDGESPRVQDSFVLTDTVGSLMLEVVYPEKVRVDSTDRIGQPMSFSLGWITPTYGSAPLSLTDNVPTTSVNIVSTGAYTFYILEVEPPADGLVFNDKDGLPASLRIALSPDEPVTTPSVLYIRRAPGDWTASVPISFSLSLYAPHSQHLVEGSPFMVTIRLERKSTAWWRAFLSQLLGPTTPLLGIAAALAAFALEEYRLAQKRRLDAEERQFKEEMTQKEHEFQTRMELAKHRREQEQKREEAQRTCLAQIEQLRVLAFQDLAAAAKRYVECCNSTEAIWKDPQVAACLADVWDTTINKLPWQRPLIAEAVEHFTDNDLHKAQGALNILCTFDPHRPAVRMVTTVVEFASADNQAKWLQEYGAAQVIAGLQQMDRDYGGMAIGTPIRERVAGLLAPLICIEHIGEIEKQLGATEHGLDLLREPECQRRLSEISRDMSAPPGAKTIANHLLARCRESPRWVTLWPSKRPDLSQPFRSWLEIAELAFNPFGPEFAELDPRLVQFYVNPFEEDIRGARPVITFGKPGSGKTAAALLLAFNCNDPPESPRESGTFPVYYHPLRPGALLQCDPCAYLRMIARATVHAIVHYLALKPNGFLELLPARQERLGELLLICAGSRGYLARQLREAAADTASSRLLHAFDLLDADVRSADELDEREWLNLLHSAWPAEFTHSYMLVEVANVRPGEEQAAATQLRPLIDLGVPLATADIHLKVFVPEALEPGLDDLPGFDVVQLEWSKENLRQLLQRRIHQASGLGSAAGRDSLEALCHSSAKDMGVDDLLIAAVGTPRDLVHLGNRLLEIHVARISDKLLSSPEDIEPDDVLFSYEDVEVWKATLSECDRV
jgi:hypothetical protein